MLISFLFVTSCIIDSNSDTLENQSIDDKLEKVTTIECDVRCFNNNLDVPFNAYVIVD